MKRRVVLLALAALLLIPSTAFADGVVFGFIGGTLYAPRPTSPSGLPATNDPGVVAGAAPATLTYVTRTVGPIPGTHTAPTYGIAPFSGTFPGGVNFGTVTFATGAPVAFIGSTSLGDGTVFAGGGFVTITSNAGFATATGGAIPSGTVLFTGSFTGPVTLTQINAPSASCSASPTCLASFNYGYVLSGPVGGTLDPLLMALLGLTGPNNAVGFMLTLNLGYVGPTDNYGVLEDGLVEVTVPEPGTLALFGTGLLGLAGVIRRRLMS
jgi:hypothetical protein